MRSRRKKPGRKQLPARQVKSQFFGLRLSVLDRETLQWAATNTGTSMSQFIRDAALRDADHVEDLAMQMTSGKAGSSAS